MNDICAICLDPPSIGGLALACRHIFHSQCLLASFSGETPGNWKCPCCRSLVSIRLVNTKKNKEQPSKAFIKSSSAATGGDSGADAHQVTDEESVVVLPPNIHYYHVEESKWGTLQAFLTAATCALAEQHHHEQQQRQVQHTCARSTTSSHFNLLKTTSNILSATTSARCMALAEKFLPPTESITAFLSHAQLQRLLDPTLPHPLYRVIRYITIVVLSLGAIILGVWLLRFLMFAFGVAVCAASDATTALLHTAQMDTMCVPMVPDTWALPIGFAFVGLYITLQVAAIAGFTLRHVLLKWEETACHAVGAWFLVCLVYTVFVYFARYLLTVLVSCLAPFSNNREFPGGCLPSIGNPCY